MATRTVSVRLVADIGAYVSGMARAAGITQGLNLKVAGVAGVLGGLAVGFGAAVGKAMEFEKAMSGVQAATMESAATMGRLREAIMQAGADSQYSATEAADAVTAMAKAGVSASDIMGGGLAGALDLAASGQLAVADAAEIASVAMTQFGLAGSDLPHVADLLAAGAGKAMGQVSDLGMALNQAGLVASSTGLSIEETTGVLAAFASAGLVGSDAGTSFRSMLQRLQNPSQESARTMEQLGLSLYDANGEFVGMESLAGQLRTSLSGMTQATRDQMMAQIFGSDAVRAANVLYVQGADGIADWTDKVNDAGFAQEQAAILTDNLAGDLERLGGAWDTLLISMGEGSQGPLRSLVQGLTNVLDGVSELGSELDGRLTPFFDAASDVGEDLWEILTELADTFGPLLVGFGKLAGGAIIWGLTTLAEALAAVSGWLADNEAVAIALATVLAVSLVGGVGALTAAFNRFLLTPVVLGISGMIGAVGGLTGSLAAARIALMGLLTAAAPLAAIGALVYGVVKVLDIASAADDARVEITQMWGAVEDARGLGQLEAAGDLTAQLRDKVAELRANLADDGAWESTILGALLTGALEDKEALEEYEAALERAEQKQLDLVRSATSLGNQFGLNRDQVLDLAEKYDIDLTQGAENAYLQFQRFYTTEYGPQVEARTAGVASALEDVKQQASDAKDEIDNFKLSLDILTGAHVSMLEAEMALGAAIAQGKDAMDELGGSVLNAAGGLNTQSENGRKAADVLLGVKDSGDLLIATMQQQGATEEDLLIADANLRDSFIDTAMQMGIGEDAAKLLADQILGIPAERETTITANTDQARQAVTNLQGQIDLLTAPRTAVINFRATMPDLNGSASGSGHMGTFASGGYTGPGHKYQPAGIVHAGEVVWSQEDVRAHGGVGVVESMRRSRPRGYAEGGIVLNATADTGSVNAGLNEVDATVRNAIAATVRYLEPATRAAAALNWARSQVGKPYLWAGAGPAGYDCSGFMSAITNYLRGRPLHSRIGSTATFPWSGFQNGYGMFTIGSTPNAGGGIGHMAGTLMGVNVESAGGVGVRVGAGARGASNGLFGTRAHLAMASGGLIGEPVVGQGVWSGRSYSFAERGDEVVMPRSREFSGGGSGGGGGPAIDYGRLAAAIAANSRGDVIVHTWDGGRAVARAIRAEEQQRAALAPTW